MQFIAQSPYADKGSTTEKVTQTIESLLRDRNKGIVILYIMNDKPVGLIGGLTSEMIFSHDLVASELFWWVDPNFRSRKALSLKEAFEYWARRVGAKYVAMGALPSQGEKVARFYERTGYKNLENSYLKVL
jgi:GNAT superfamily N-acetyltransferase